MQRLLKALLVGSLLVIGVVGIKTAEPAAADTCTVGGVCESDLPVPPVHIYCDPAVLCTPFQVIKSDTVSDGNGLNAQCVISLGVATPSSNTYTIAGDATATGGAGLSTSLFCKVYTANSTFRGQAANGLSGPAVVAAGISWPIPLSGLTGLRVCAYALTTYWPGTQSRTAVSSGCPPW